MKINIRVLGDLSPILGNGMTIKLDEKSKIKDLASYLSVIIDEKKHGCLGIQGIGWNNLVILINGRNIDNLDSVETELRDGNVVTLLTPIEGG